VVDWSSFAIHGRMNGAESVEISDSEGGQNYIRDSFSVNRYHNQFYEDPWSFSKPNTTYQIWVRARNSYGVSAWSSPLTVTTGSAPTPSQPSSSPTGTKIDGGFDLSWGSSSGATSYILKYRSYAGTFTKPVSGTSTSLTGLEYGVTYYISVAAKNSSGTSPYNPEDDTLNPATTAPKTPAISNPSVTNNSITIHCDNGMTGNYDDIEIQRYTSGSSYIDSMFLSKSNYNAGIRDVTWTGLPQGTDYIFKARSSFGISGVTLYSVDWSNNISTSTNARPTDWKWTTAKDIYGHKVKGNDFSILASEWNIFTDRINQFRSYKLGPGQSYSFTTAVSVGDNKVYAYMFNQAIDAIDDIVYTGLSHKLPNQDCIASDFNVLMDKLNSIS
jgi:hypothetical protein